MWQRPLVDFVVRWLETNRRDDSQVRSINLKNAACGGVFLSNDYQA